jgi:hypothetical protein
MRNHITVSKRKRKPLIHQITYENTSLVCIVLLLIATMLTPQPEVTEPAKVRVVLVPDMTVQASEIVPVTPTIAPVVPERQQIEEYIKSKDWNSDEALKVAICESGLNPLSHGDRNLNPSSYGIFQIRAYHNRPSPDELLNWKVNIDTAYDIYKSWGNSWDAWTCKYTLNTQ